MGEANLPANTRLKQKARRRLRKIAAPEIESGLAEGISAIDPELCAAERGRAQVDGVHVEPVMVDLFLRAKGIDGAVLITDGISATGMPDGTYRLGFFEVQVSRGRCESFGKLAGSVLTLDQAVHNVMQFASLSFQDSLRLATLNPARVLGIEHHKGVLREGADAGIAVFSPAGEVRQTNVGGRMSS